MLKKTLLLSCSTLMLSFTANAGLIGHWEFNADAPLADSTGNFDDLTLTGASVVDGSLIMNGTWAQADRNSSDTITNKTLISWVTLTDLNRGGGSALTLDTQGVDIFDAIVWNERNTGWMNGSNSFTRSTGDEIDLSTTVENVEQMLAITHSVTGSTVTVNLYIDGVLQDSDTYSAVASYGSNAEILFGTRHTNPGPVGNNFAGRVSEARLYDTALTEQELMALMVPNDNNPDPIPTPPVIALFMTGLTLLVGHRYKRK